MVNFDAGTGAVVLAFSRPRSRQPSSPSWANSVWRAFLRSSDVIPYLSLALAVGYRLVWHSSCTAASVRVASSFHGCSASASQRTVHGSRDPAT